MMIVWLPQQGKHYEYTEKSMVFIYAFVGHSVNRETIQQMMKDVINFSWILLLIQWAIIL